jgi:hypothetical protein
MFTMHPTLLIGPADWDSVHLPKKEFLARIEALWQHDPSVGGAIVYGDSRDHADLAYLTNFTPKLEPALALIPRAGEPRLLVGGGANMLSAAKPLTWIETFLPLRDAAKTIAEWAHALPGANRLLLINGDNMRYAMHREIIDVLRSEIALVPASPRQTTRVPRNSAREIAAIRQSCMTLAIAVAALEQAKRDRDDATRAVLDAERAAYGRGAQDVRTLLSLDAGRTLQPLGISVAETDDPLQVYIAVRQLGYWSERFVMLADQPHRPLFMVRERLRSAVALVSPGMRRGDLAQAIVHSLGPSRPHPMTATLSSIVVSIDLSLEETGNCDDVLATGEVISLRAGVSDQEGAAIVSTMVVVNDQSCDVLWSI